MQRSFKVNNEKITIKSRPLTSMGNLRGFSIDINKEKSRHYVLTREEAEDIAFSRWVKKQTR